MGLETGTFISDLTTAWPLASDQKRQGDDHLRLIKTVVKNTLPNATKPFYFPFLEPTAIAIVLDATDQNRTITLDTTAGNVAVTLPSGLAASDAGFALEIVKVSADANAGIVTPAAGNVLSKSGSTATIRVGQYCEPAKFTWNGSFWLCYKPGPLIGTTEEFDGPNLPAGFLWGDGAAFSSTAFAELFAATGIAATRDKRGRVSAGRDNMGGVSAARLTIMASTTLGAGGGVQAYVQTQAQMPFHTHAGSSFNVNTQADSPDHSHVYERYLSIFPVSIGGDSGCWAGVSFQNTGGASTTHVHNVFGFPTVVGEGGGQQSNIIQPTMIVNKIVRAC